MVEILYDNILSGQQKTIINIAHNMTDTAMKSKAIDLLQELDVKVLSFYLAKASATPEKL